MKRICLVFAMFCLAVSGIAQEEFVLPEAKLLTRFPFTQLSGGIVIVKARIDHYKDSLNFVFDTGSGGISMDSTTVSEMKLVTVKSEKTIRGIAGIKNVDFTMNHTLTLGTLETQHLDFHINDYELLTSVYGVRIDGIIGYSFLRRYIVRLDYDNMLIEVYTPGSFKYPRGGYLLKPNFSTLPLQPAVIQDERTITSRFIFDTGAGLSFLLSKDFVDDSVVFRKKRRFYPTQAEGLGGKRQMMVSVVQEIKLGPYKFKRVPVHIFEDEYNVTSYPLLGGLIGNDILRRFNVILNYPEMSIHIKPNTHYNESFDYSYTGLGIYLIDGEIRVIDVIPDSPGDKAGFLPGDVIFSVETNASKNIQTYKNIFQNSIGKMKVIVFRNQKPLVLTIDIKDIRR
ncbi:MAG: aspartyl protease family protein [Chitinophagaceae bacterium]|nr:aspartyl protease family protein [Chitinophagaceae bacterium]MCA6452396.1 aspartyl protease family protein [Chitinophagaceae bacterium]MCA6456635.1 aspartyl protease family protein [Chitinophagaceae bacterium]MCA6458753.1 aspartyl protease family protein [Chitinophagaceae bacterium]MCA6464261.1 aspartyl protease family protein [Chitinophagaceae bacterium]